jgi:hypothetical protein
MVIKELTLPSTRPSQEARRVRYAVSSSAILANLLQDTSAPTLAYLAEKYGLRRVPGLTKQALVDRIIRLLDTQQRSALQDELIASRYGTYSVAQLVRLAVARDHSRSGGSEPRLDLISPDMATLVRSSQGSWVYTMRGHDVMIDTSRHVLGCNCRYFVFAARRKAICKHLATAFELIPEVYARETLIDLLVAREYGGRESLRWRFQALPARD